MWFEMDSAERRRRRELCAGEDCGSFAEEVVRLAGLGENTERTRKAFRLFLNDFEVGIEAGQEKDPAGREFAIDIFEQRKPVATRHGDIAKQQIRLEFAGLLQGGIRGVGSLRFKTAFTKDKREGVSYESFIVYDQNTLHRGPLFVCGHEPGHQRGNLAGEMRSGNAENFRALM